MPQTEQRLAWKIALILLTCGAGACACGTLTTKKTQDTATFEVKPSTLVREIEALGALRPVKATLITPPSDLQEQLKIVFLEEDGATVKKGAVVVRFDDGDFRRRFAREEFSGRDANTKLAKERTLIDATQAERVRSTAIAEREQGLLNQFQQKDTEIFSRHQIVESEINQGLQTSKVDYAKSAQRIDRQIAQARLGLLAVDQTKATFQMRQAAKALSKLEVLAPNDGVFVLERNWAGEAMQVGDVVWSRQTIAQIPLLDAMEAEVFVLEADADGLEAGRSATFVLDAAPNRLFSAKVKRVDSIAKRRYSGVPTQYFTVILSLSEVDTHLLKPGKRVSAKLNLGSVQGLVLPRQVVFEKDAHFFVFRQQPNHDFVQVPVKLGATTAGRVLIRAGLRAGDQVALTDPFASQIETPGAETDSAASAKTRGPTGPTGPRGPKGRHEN